MEVTGLLVARVSNAADPKLGKEGISGTGLRAQGMREFPQGYHKNLGRVDNGKDSSHMMTRKVNLPLTEDKIREAYQLYSQGQPFPEDCPLFSTTLFSRRMSEVGRRYDESTTGYVLTELIEETLINELNRFRSMYNLREIDPNLNAEEAKIDLAIIGQTEHRLLIAGSAIYYKYLRSELNLNLKDMAKEVAHDPRNLQRLTNAFWSYLYNVFVGLEQQAIEQDRHEQWLCQLPRLPKLQLKTQKTAAEYVAALLQSFSPQAVVVYGEEGIGKSTIAALSSQMILEQNYTDEFVWLDLTNLFSRSIPVSGENLAFMICDQLLLPRRHDISFTSTLRIHLSRLNTQKKTLMVVADGAEKWLDALLELQVLLTHCTLLVTSQTPLPRWWGVEFNVSVLDEGDGLKYLQYLEHLHRYPLGEGHAERIYHMMGGNPACIKAEYLRTKFNSAA